MLYSLLILYHSQNPLIHCASSWLSFLVCELHLIRTSLYYLFSTSKIFERRGKLACWTFPRQISRYLPVLTLGPPLRSGNAALFTLLSHGSGECCREGPSGESVRKHAHTPRFGLHHRLSSSHTKPSRAQAAVPRRRRGRLFGSDLGKKGKVNTKTSAAITKRRNFESEEAIA